MSSESYISFTLGPILESVLRSMPPDEAELTMVRWSSIENQAFNAHIIVHAKMYLYQMLSLDSAGPEDVERVRSQVVGLVSYLEAQDQYGREYLANPLHRLIQPVQEQEVPVRA